MSRNRWARPSDHVTRTKRWRALRQQALRRDGFKCTECGSRYRLQVHHVKRSEKFPELAYELDNLLTLCGPCHSRVTVIEVGIAPLDPERRKWRDLLRDMRTSKRGQ